MFVHATTFHEWIVVFSVFPISKSMVHIYDAKMKVCDIPLNMPSLDSYVPRVPCLVTKTGHFVYIDHHHNLKCITIMQPSISFWRTWTKWFIDWGTIWTAKFLIIRIKFHLPIYCSCFTYKNDF